MTPPSARIEVTRHLSIAYECDREWSVHQHAAKLWADAIEIARRRRNAIVSVRASAEITTAPNVATSAMPPARRRSRDRGR